MRLIVEIKTDGAANGVATGTAELFAEGCKTDAEKALAQMLAGNVVLMLDVVRRMTEKLFVPPENGSVEVASEVSGVKVSGLDVAKGGVQ